MKKLILFITLFNLSTAFAQKSDEILTNNSIIQMLHMGLSPSIIVSKIKTSESNFSITTDDLISLKQQKVSDEIVNAMIEATNGSGNSSKISGDPNDPHNVHAPGIYWYKAEAGKKKMIQLDPTVCSASKSDGYLASRMSYGIAKVNTKSTINNPQARTQLDTTLPVFYFYFETINSGLSQSGYYFNNSTSPNEFALVKLTPKTKNREMIVGESNAFGSQSGIPDRYLTHFEYEKIAPGAYKVYFTEPIKLGEYCFFYAGATPQGSGYGTKVFDFGIH